MSIVILLLICILIAILVPNFARSTFAFTVWTIILGISIIILIFTIYLLYIYWDQVSEKIFGITVFITITVPIWFALYSILGKKANENQKSELRDEENKTWSHAQKLLPYEEELRRLQEQFSEKK